MLTIVVGDRIAGLVQYAEETDVIGTEAIRQLARHLIEDRGHHRITIDPAAANAQASATWPSRSTR
jgi:aminoglycoside 6'-N-acetyltransferase